MTKTRLSPPLAGIRRVVCGSMLLLTWAWSAAAQPEHSSARPPGSALRPIPSAVRERLQQMMEKRGDRQPGEMRDRMEQMRERIREARERREHVRGTTRELDEGLHKDDIKREDLQKRIEEYKKLRSERRLERRAEIFRLWGLGLNQPEVKEELEQHARRMAKLRRLEILTATDRKGEKRKKLMGRIEKLRQAEKDRHHEAMKKMLPGRGGSALASSGPISPPAAAGSAPAANAAALTPPVAPAPAVSGGAP